MAALGESSGRKRKLERRGVEGTGSEATYFNEFTWTMTCIRKCLRIKKQRMKLYRDAFEQNAEHLKDKIVLDVGAGTGI